VQSDQRPERTKRIIPGTSPSADLLLSILILNGHFPEFPGTGGYEFNNTTNLAELVAKVGLVSMIHTADTAGRTGVFTERGIELYLWRSPHIGAPAPAPRRDLLSRLHGRLFRLVCLLRAFPSRPTDTTIADLNFRNMSAPLLKALARRHWDIFVVVQSSSAAVIDCVPKVGVSALVMHDIRSVVYDRQADTADSWWRRLQLRREARRYFHFEKKYAQQYDLLIAVSESDAQWIREHYRPNRVEVVPIPVNAAYWAPVDGVPERPNRILFPGLMQHPPNVDAAVFFAREVFPKVRQEMPEAEFSIVGKYPTAEVLELARLPGVTVTGAVPDTRPYLAEATVVVAPLRFGSGVRQKILEAWAMEKCVIATSMGAEGLRYQDGVNLVIADDAASLARAVTAAMRNPEERRRLGRSGRAFAVEHHNPKETVARYHAHLRSVAEAKSALHAPMRVALDMRWLVPGLAGGLENLARSFVRELISLDAYNSYTMILPAVCRHDFDLRDRTNFRVICRDSVATVAKDLLWQATRALHAALRLDYPRSAEVRALEFLRSLDAEIVYSFPGYIHPEVGHLRQLLMVPDIQHEYLPECFSEEALRERRRIYTDSIRQADHICAISEFTRRTLIERLAVPPAKVTTVPLAADPIFRPTRDPAFDKTCLAKYRLLSERPYLFFPGHTWKHKNHRAAISAMAILRDRYGLSPQLICTGGAREGQPELERQTEQLGLGGQVRFLGYCPHEDLPAFYRHAGCLLFPSLFEGFGIPVLEAMACGCPVVCSNTTSLPEVAGEAALLVEPNDPEAIAEAVSRVLREDGLREHLVIRGFERAREFSWRRHTRETVAILHRLHEQLRGRAPK